MLVEIRGLFSGGWELECFKVVTQSGVRQEICKVPAALRISGSESEGAISFHHFKSNLNVLQLGTAF